MYQKMSEKVIKICPKCVQKADRNNFNIFSVFLIENTSRKGPSECPWRALGRLWASFLLFEITLFSNMGPRWSNMSPRCSNIPQLSSNLEPRSPPRGAIRITLLTLFQGQHFHGIILCKMLKKCFQMFQNSYCAPNRAHEHIEPFQVGGIGRKAC